MMMEIDGRMIDVRPRPPVLSRAIEWRGLRIVATSNGVVVINESGEHRGLHLVDDGQPASHHYPELAAGGCFYLARY